MFVLVIGVCGVDGSRLFGYCVVWISVLILSRCFVCLVLVCR